MRESLIERLRCPFCGSRLTVVENDALVLGAGRIDAGVLGCDCCAFPVVAGIPVLTADDVTREAMHRLEAGDGEGALFDLLGLDAERAAVFGRLLTRREPMTYREALAVLCQDAEAENFLYRMSDPTFVTAEALLGALAQTPWVLAGPVLDVCAGSGHLTRVLARLRSTGAADEVGVVGADVYFWKLWMARRFTVPDGDSVCCDANNPLPFAPRQFSLAVLADAFPYIWHKRLLAEELVRAVGPEGVVVMPHLHSSLGENFSAGMTRTPAGYAELFAPQQPRLFSDERLFDDVLEHRRVDLTRSFSPEELGAESSFTLIATPRTDVFRVWHVPESFDVAGALTVNPLYRVERGHGQSVLTLAFPTPEYEEEFGACKRYLPAQVTLGADVTAPIRPEALGTEYENLRRRRVILDAPPHYC